MQIYCSLIHQESSKQTICKVGVTDLAFWHSFWQFSHAVIAYFYLTGISTLLCCSLYCVLVKTPNPG